MADDSTRPPPPDSPDGGPDSEAGQSDLDPALVARLEAWFGAPTTAVEPSPPPPRPVGNATSTADEERARRRRAALEAVSRGPLERHIEARARRSAAVIEPLPPMTLVPERPPNRFDLSRWRLLHVEAGEAEPPEDVWDALAERTPQALLRDLHRPVFYFDDVELERTEVIPEGTLNPIPEIQALLTRDYRWRPQDRPMLALAEDELRALRRRLRHESWADAPAEIARIRRAREPGQPDDTEPPEREPTTEELIALFEPPR